MDDVTQRIVDAAKRAVELSDGRLDFSEASLGIVEDMLAEAAPYACELSPAQLTALAQQFGCYILEVGRREFGGRYLWDEQRSQPVLVVGEPKCRIALVAWDKVYGRVGGEIGNNIPFFYAGFAARARRATPGDDALYT